MDEKTIDSIIFLPEVKHLSFSTKKIKRKEA